MNLKLIDKNIENICYFFVIISISSLSWFIFIVFIKMTGVMLGDKVDLFDVIMAFLTIFPSVFISILVHIKFIELIK